MSHRVTATLDDDSYERLKYWANKHGLSINEYIAESIDMMIRYDNHDFDIPDLMTQRLNQLIDGMSVLSQNVRSLEDITVSGFDSLLNLCKGDSYLLEAEDGEI